MVRRQAIRMGIGAFLLVSLSGGLQDLSAQVPAADLQGREIIMVTGSTDGIGREIALALAGPGTHIIVHGRNIARGDSVVAMLREKGSTARFLQADLGSLAQVRELAAAVLRDYSRLDILVNNAGIGRGLPEAPREVSADGYELRFAVNYLSHYYLSYALLPILRAGAPSRIVSVSSSAQGSGEMDFNNLMLDKAPYEGAFAYAQSKLAQIFMTFDMNEELQGTGVTVNAAHPGGLLDTSMVRERGGTATMPASEGAEFIVNAIRWPEGGLYFGTMQPTQANPQAYDMAARQRLRTMTRQWVGMN